MSNQLTELQDATIKQQCKVLRMPMMGSQFRTLAEQAIREKKTHLGYLETVVLQILGGNLVGFGLHVDAPADAVQRAPF
jgi:hypothetical protein